MHRISAKGRLIALLLIFCSRFCIAEPLIWVSEMNTSDSVKSSGVNLENRLFDLLSQRAEITFVYQQANSKRAESILLSTPNACTGNKLKTQQRLQTFPMTTLPQTLFLGQRLYLSNDLLLTTIKQTFNARSQVQLSELLRTKNELMFGIQDGRSYGDKVDSIIQNAETSRRIYRRNDAGTAQGMVDMLLAGRVDLIIEYPNVLRHYQQTSAHKNVPLHSFPLAELDRYHAGYIMCSPGEQGQQLIAQLNKAIVQSSQEKQYLQLHLDWYPPDTHKELTEVYNKVYGTGF